MVSVLRLKKETPQKSIFLPRLDSTYVSRSIESCHVCVEPDGSVTNREQSLQSDTPYLDTQQENDACEGAGSYMRRMGLIFFFSIVCTLLYRFILHRFFGVKPMSRVSEKVPGW